MRRQSIAILAFAILLGLVAVVLANAYLSGVEQRERPTAGVQATRVAVARANLEFGARLQSENVAFVDWPANSVPAGSFTSSEELFRAGNDRFVMRSISVGEPILASRLSGDGRPSIAGRLGPDGRAMSIRISDVAGVAGFVLPGDRVDIILVRDANGDQIADILLQNVRVIAIDQIANEDRQQLTAGEAGSLKTATLEVSPDEAQRLVLGSAVGTMSLALRSPRAHESGAIYPSLPLRASQLAGSRGVRTQARVQVASPSPLPRPARPQSVRRTSPIPARAQSPSVEIVRGTAAQNYEVPNASF